MAGISLLLLTISSLSSCNAAVTQTELTQIMQTIWNVDSNRLDVGTDITINLQTQTSLYDSRDRASGRYASISVLLSQLYKFPLKTFDET